MARGITSKTVGQLFNALFRPARFVGADVDALHGSIVTKANQLFGLVLVLTVNVVAYGVPLTLGGAGTIQGGGPPALVADLAPVVGARPDVVWRFVLRLAENCVYLLVATGLTFVTFHLSTVVTLSSSGILPTLHTVVYSTSAYLAGVFSFVWYIATAKPIAVADQLVLNVQTAFIYFFIDWMGADLALPSGRPRPVDTALLTLEGKLAIAGLAVMCGYFIYSMYLGSRLNHNASRTTGLLTIGAVLSAPAVFVLGSIIAAMIGVSLL